MYQGNVLKGETTMEENKVLENGSLVFTLSKGKAGAGATPTSSPEPNQGVVTDVSSSTPAQTFTPLTASVAIVPSGAAHIQAVPHLSAGSTSETAVQQILDIGGGSWDRDSVLRALRAASNNLEQALQCLSSDIPETTELAPSMSRTLLENSAGAPSIASAVPAHAVVPVSGPNAAPPELLPQDTPALGADGGSAGDLDFFRNSSEVPQTNDEDSSDASEDASASVGTGDAASTNGVHDGSAEGGSIYYLGGMNGYPPHGYVYDYVHGGFEPSVAGEWDDYSRYVVDGVEIPSPGVYSDNGSVYVHATGYGYASNPSYTPYTPGAPVPTIGADGQLYGPQAFQYPSHLYPQPVSPGTQYHVGSPTAITGGERATTGNGEPAPPGVDGKIALSNGGPRPGYPAMALIPPHGPYARGVLPLAMHNPGSQDVRYDGLSAAAPSWVDVSKIPEGLQRRGIPTGMHSMASQQLSAPGLPAQSLRPITPLQIHIQSPQQSRNPSGLGPFNLGPGALARGYPPVSGVVNGHNGPVRARQLGNTFVDPRPNGRGGWIGIDKGKQRCRGGGPIGNSNGSLDPLNEQNRGPRTIRTRNQRAIPGVLRHTRGQGVISSGNSDALNAFVNREQYNKPEFIINYDHAKFFVIKSYSEDDVHKSIKYNVWASTPVGNKRLDAAYLEALAKSNGDTKSFPVFLFFSVNASGQFCGVAQMTGPVDFSKSVDFWQQDKWNGRFPVVWHIIKDIPNCQFRHIILENNDNKPVTNSRDTQEVKFEQGFGMLNIFKNFASKTSILDDFQFYENRQRALSEKRARQQAQKQRELHRQGGGRTVGNEFESASIKEVSTLPNHGQIVERLAADNPEETIAAQPVEGSHALTPQMFDNDDSDENRSQIGSVDRLTTGVAEINIGEGVKTNSSEETQKAGSGSGSELVVESNNLLSEQDGSTAVGDAGS
ncbi:YTH domain-containing protein ECT4 isoform X2 [Physcomitrium patens]|uniref:YTH domain-containing protein ECT4 isoform X2 n=1 Tax=Physcomitrium patens TaxID=3218 RepID=UPI000D165752|nr:YTH domain-containing family protein 2-like isoform X2 [Physcomitrium patens]|eukprot:XP_024385834.1 YTH domain-containing family protein 2-like isoform X2 [Physcomitrella patens]